MNLPASLIAVTEVSPGIDGAERQLWCAVLHRLVDDALDAARYGVARPSATAERRLNQQKARSWIGTLDFTIVCHLAGLDPEAVADRVRAKMAAET